MSVEELEATLPSVSTISLDGATVAYRFRTGTSEEAPLVLVHGLGSSSLTFSRLVPELPSDRALVLVDLPGCGKSERCAQPVSIRSFGHAVSAVLDELGIEQADWIAHSMGAHVSIRHALSRPERFRSLFLVAPAGIERFSAYEGALMRASVQPKALQAQGRDDIERHMRLAFSRWIPEAEALVAARMSIRGEALRQYTEVFKESVTAMLTGPVHDEWPDLKPKTHMLFGLDDQLIPNKIFHSHLTTQRLAESAKRRRPETLLTLIDGAGHMAHFERPKRVAEALRFGLPPDERKE